MQKKKAAFFMSPAGLLFLALLSGAFFFPAEAGAGPASGAQPLTFRTFTVGPNADYPPEDATLSVSMPNVLFYMDVSANMAMSMKGQRPITPSVAANAYTLYPNMRNANLRTDMLKQDTFGMGGRPFTMGTGDMQADRRDPATHLDARIQLGTEIFQGYHPGSSYYTQDTDTSQRWGRDIDEDNNVIGHPDYYYSLDREKPYLLTFRHKTLAEWDGDWDGETITQLPQNIQDFMDGTAEGQRLRDFFIAHVPAGEYDENGNFRVRRDDAGAPRYKPKVEVNKENPHPNFCTANLYLVPNDSKLYNVKLVLSRILEPEPANMAFLSRMRVGMATTFYERYVATNPTPATSAGMKRPPFRMTGPGVRDNSGDPLGNPNAGNNTLYIRATVHMPGASGTTVHDFYSLRHTDADTSGAYGPYISRPGTNSHEIIRGTTGTYGWFIVPDDSGVAYHGSDTRTNNMTLQTNPNVDIYGGVMPPATTAHYKRSVLHVPFDRMYDDDSMPTPALITFREMIDGVEQRQAAGGRSVYVNDELFITSLPGSAEDLIYNSAGYSRTPQYPLGADGSVQTNLNTNPSQGNLTVMYNRMRNSEGLMTGTVVGTILDFFSPRSLGFASGNQETGANDTRGYFPVTGSCQGNYVIYFTTGNETRPGRSHTEAGTMMHSLFNIAMESRTMRGRRWNAALNSGSGGWGVANIAMDNPIHTIVVGLISREGMENDGDPYDPDDPSDITKNLRNAMRRMAHAGWPRREGGGWAPDTNRRPIFADDVPGLIAQLNAVLQSFQMTGLSGGAPRLENPQLNPAGEVVLFSSGYTPDSNRQWGATFERRSIPKDERESQLDWEAGEMMAAAATGTTVTVTNASSGAMNIQNARDVFVFTGNLDTGSGSTVRLDSDALLTGNAFEDLTGVSNVNDRAAYVKWLLAYRTTVNVNGEEVEAHDNGILGNMQRSSPMFVPKENPTNIFIQTNRGVLHNLDYVTGEEKWAFLPPQVFLTRAWRQKFKTEGSGSGITPKSGWIGALPGEDGENGPISKPLMLLDGLMTVNEFTVDGVTSRFLMGAMGLSGNGFYMMNISNPASNPVFMWAIDNDRYNYNITSSGIPGYSGRASSGTLHAVGDAYGSNPGSGSYNSGVKQWEDLGLTIVAPELRQLWDGSGIVGFVPGGLGWELGLIPADRQGRAFYVFNHLNAGIIKKITSDVGYEGPGVLGMGITPVYYIPATGRTQEFFTGDSEGNVLYCDARMAPGDWTLRNIFRLRAQETNPGSPIALPHAYEIVRFSSGHGRWLFGGTADILAPEDPYVPREYGDDGAPPRQRGIYNEEQYIFALKNIDSDHYLGNPTYDDVNTIPRLNELVSLTWYETNLANNDVQNEAAVRANQYGWKLRLAPPDPSRKPPTGAEYVTAPPHFNAGNGVLYVATFTPYTTDELDEDAAEGGCDVGFARFYAFDPTTGKPIWNEGHTQAYEFKNVKIVGISDYNRKINGKDFASLFLGVRALSGGALSGFGDYDELNYTEHGDSTVEIETAHGGGGGTPDLEPVIPHPQYWREVF